MSKDEKILSFPNVETIEAEASAWVAQMDRGEMTTKDRQAFESWHTQSEQHREAFISATAVWEALDDLSGLKPIKDSGLCRPTLMERAGLEMKYRIAALTSLAAAASVAFIFIVEPGVFSSQENALQVHRTVVGSQKNVLLADGSELLLNTDSEVEIELTEVTRTVRLLKGEVHFTVASDKDRPFSVYVDNHVVTAVGTAFAVYRRESTIEVTVTEGDVNLYLLPDKSDSLNEKVESVRADPLVNLTAGENAVVGETVELVEVIPTPEMNRKLAWRQGLLAFAGDPLSDVVTEVSRYTDIEIIIRDPSLRSLRFGGFLKVGNVNTLFNALEQSFGVTVQREGNTTVYLFLAEN